MRLHPALLAAGLLLAGCTSYAEQERAGAELAAVRAITMAGPSLSWEEMGVHPQLIARACSVDTLVNRSGDVVGYCTGGQTCRTMDWRPVEAACDARVLAEVLAGRAPRQDCGDLALLRRYERARREDIAVIGLSTDALQKLFGAQSVWLSGVRNFGLGALNHLPVLKNLLIQHAAA